MGTLRFFLALAVVFAHAGGAWSGFSFGNGRIAVQTFYMISGFYMAMVWSQKYSCQAKPIRTFYLSRALRIYPLYFIVLAISILEALYLLNKTPEFTLLTPYNSSLGWISLLWVYLTQITLVGMETSIFFGLDSYWISPVSWTLGLELTFYLLVPFLLPRPRLVLFVFVTALVARYVCYHHLNWQSGTAYQYIWSYRFFPFEIALFLAGTLAYMALARMPSRLTALITLPESFVLAIFIMIGSLCYLNLGVLFPYFIAHPYLIEGVYWCYYAVAFGGIIILFHNTKNSKHDSYLGELSYPIYILHLPIIWFLLYVTHVAEAKEVIYWAVPATIAFSMIFAKLQTYIDNFRHSLVNNSATP